MMAVTESSIDRSASGASRAGEPPPLSRREIWFVFVFWATFAVVTVANRVVALGWPNTGPRGLSHAALAALIESALWALLTVFVFRWVERSDATRGPRSSTIARLAALSVPAALFMGVVGALLRLWFDLLPPGIDPRRALRPGIGVGFLMALVIYGAVTAAALARTYSRRYRAREAHAARLEAQLASAQLDALRRQLDPHFLFNTLNLISSIADSDPRGVRRMITRLSELLRFSFDGADAAEVPLRDELALLDRYLDIMRMRFRERLEVERRIEEDTLDALVPSLILQPLVENAIKHGVEKLRGTGCIQIESIADEETLILRVRNNGPAVPPSLSGGGGGVGIRNTVDRLQQLYGGAGSFALKGDTGGGTIAEVRLPRRTPSVLRTRGVSVAEEGHADVR